MNIDYFYAPPEAISGDTVRIEGEEFAHMTHVMRKREGDLIRVVNGEGTAYDVRIISFSKKTVDGQILATLPRHNESEKHIALAVGMLKNPSRFDFLVEKATELGVSEIIPMTTARTISHHAKTDRWQKLALSAMKQSCRSLLPIIRTADSLETLLKQYNQFETKILFHEKADRKLTGEQKHSGTTLILVGPEGGFSDDEVALCEQHGCTIYSLGERRLRTETAAIIAVGLVGM